MQCLRRCALAFAGLALACALGLFLALWFAADWLVDVQPPEKSDVIVVLAGEPARAFQGAELYRAGIAPRVYVSVEVPHWRLARMAEAGVLLPRGEAMMQQVLAARGVPPEAVQLFGKDLISTVAEGEALRTALPPQAKRITVVTSPYHTRRAGIILRRALPGREIRMVANTYEPYASEWWNNKSVAMSILIELASTVFYYAGGRF